MKNVLVQSQIWNEFGYQNYLDSFRDISNLVETSIIPFTETMNPEPDFIPDLIMGSGRMVNIARNRNWPTFPSFEPVEFGLIDQYHWLNSTAWESTVGELDIGSDLILRSYGEVFVKPFSEKLFTGGILKRGEKVFDSFQFTKTFEEVENERLFVAPPVSIIDESRFFVVGGQVITGSLYKSYGTPQYLQSKPTDEEWILLENLIKKSNIDDSYVGVIDVTIKDGELKIIEMNNLNSAGVYASNYDALSRALINYI